MERIGEIIPRIERAHFLEGPPTEEELVAHLSNVIPPTLQTYVVRRKVSGNVLTIFVSDPVSRQELSLRAPEICDQLNARLGRNALGEVKAKLKR